MSEQPALTVRLDRWASDLRTRASVACQGDPWERLNPQEALVVADLLEEAADEITDRDREELMDLLRELPSTVHVGSPRSISARVAHAEVPDAVDAFLAWLEQRDDH